MLRRKDSAVALARKIMVIRHAEKPPDTPPPNGIDADGTIDPESLTPRGWQRAGALVRYFDPVHTSGESAIAVPNVLMASSKSDRGSMRAIQTIAPLAELLKLNIATFDPNDIGNAVDEAKASDGIVLMCWRHEAIPSIGEAIAGAGIVPASWPGDRFDLVWVFDLEPNSGKYRFTQIPEDLLSGDLTAIIR